VTTITRRRFLQGIGAGGALLAVGCGGSGSPSGLGGGVTPPVAVPKKPILVLVDLDGGNDWLSLLPPLSGPNRAAYDAARPTLGIAPGGTTDLGGGVGLNRDFTGMADLFGRGRLALLPGVGMNNPNLSHFVSTDLWGQGSAMPDGTGWLGRYADLAFDPTGDVLRGIGVTNDLPVMLRGSRRAFVSITSANGYVYPAWLRSNRIGSPFDPALLEAGFGSAAASTSADPASAGGYAAVAGVSRLFFDAQNGFGTDGSLPARTPTVSYPGDADYPVKRLDGSNLASGLASQLKLVAQMIASGIPGQVFFTRIGGWDTHSNQAVDHPNLLRALGGSLEAFWHDLQSISTPDGNAQDRTMIVGWSEFGRRVPENKGGTDHGTAGLSFALGNAVKGGVHGTYPDLASLDRNQNMQFTVDFRSLYATVLERWFGETPSATDALLDASYPRLGFL
jgi:uncharacterized protein (DUF1501 family)